MKKWILIFFIITTITKIQAQYLDSSIKASITKYLPSWTKSFKSFNLSDFKKSKSKNFEDIDVKNLAALKEFYAVYKPIITFSKDKTKFIDIYSYHMPLEKKGNVYYFYGGDPDQQIALCDLKNKEWKRILFHGTVDNVEDAIWVSNTKFVLVGISELYYNEKKNTSVKEAVIYVGDTERKVFDIYTTNSNKKCIRNIEEYVSPRLKKIKIVFK